MRVRKREIVIVPRWLTEAFAALNAASDWNVAILVWGAAMDAHGWPGAPVAS